MLTVLLVEFGRFDKSGLRKRVLEILVAHLCIHVTLSGKLLKLSIIFAISVNKRVDKCLQQPFDRMSALNKLYCIVSRKEICHLNLLNDDVNSALHRTVQNFTS